MAFFTVIIRHLSSILVSMDICGGDCPYPFLKCINKQNFKGQVYIMIRQKFSRVTMYECIF